ncbi:hypothetical protein ABKN59_011836 [Abortiporus biennis]
MATSLSSIQGLLTRRSICANTLHKGRISDLYLSFILPIDLVSSRTSIYSLLVAIMEPLQYIEAGRKTGIDGTDGENIAPSDTSQDKSQQGISEHPQIQETQHGSDNEIAMKTTRMHGTNADSRQVEHLVDELNQQAQVPDAQVNTQSRPPGTIGNMDFRAQRGVANDQSNFQPDNLQQHEKRDDYEQKGLKESAEAWSGLSSNLKKYDEDRIKRVNDDMDTLLVFAGEYNRQNDVIALCHAFLCNGRYPALLVLSICVDPFTQFSDLKNFFTQIEVSSDSAIKHFIEAVSEITLYLVSDHKYEFGTQSKPDLPVNSLHGGALAGIFVVPSERLPRLCLLTYTVLNGVDESLIKCHSDDLLDMKKSLVEAVDLLQPPRWVPISEEEALQKTLNFWRNKAPSPAHQEATGKLLDSLLVNIRMRCGREGKQAGDISNSD